LLQRLLEALEVIAKVVFEVLLVVVVALVIAGLAAALILKAPILAGTAVVLLASGVFYIIERMRQQPEGPDTVATLAPMTLDFPGVSVRLPAEDAGFFCAAAEFVGVSAFRALHDHVRALLGEVPLA
jgi:hypothetical protein